MSPRLLGPHPRRTPLGSPAGRCAAAAAALLTAAASLAQAVALINLGWALGGVVTGEGDDAVRRHLLAVVVAAVAAGVAHVAVETTARLSAQREEGRLRHRALVHLLDLGPAHAADLRSGSTISLLTDGLERVAVYRQAFLGPTVAAALSPAVALVLTAVVIDPVSSAVLLLAVVLVPWFIGVLHKKVRRSSSRSRNQRVRLAGEYLSAIQGLTTLVLARAGQRRWRELRQAGEDNRRAVMGLLAGNQLVILLTDGLFSLFFVTAAAGLALVRLRAGAIDVGDALALTLTSFVLLEPLDRVGSFFYVGMGGMANQRALRRLLATRRPEGTTAPAGPDGSAGATAPQQANDDAVLRLDGVTAQWVPERPVLTRANLSVRAGQRLALTGPSGAGKSTVMAMLAGDLLPAAGRVSVDGTVLSAATQDEVRAASAVVAQSTWLFAGTIADNLRVAAPDADEPRMWRALREANLADEVSRMPRGLDTVVGEEGLGLSGGQAQRVSLARAFLADRPVLLLDEPTSQVDLAGEAEILQALERLSQGRTVVTVSHREAAVLSADRVVRVADGDLAPAERV